MSEESAKTAETVDEKANTQKEEWTDFFKFLIKLLLVILIFRSFVFSPFNIPSESMQPRLLIGDYLFVSKWSYGYSKYSLPYSVPLIPGRIFASEPERGDVVVFKAPPVNDVDYIKRVIGLPGDTVQIVNGEVVLNGTLVPREKLSDFVIPVTENMISANDGEPCYRPEFEERAEDGTRHCRYPRYRETLPNGKSYAVLDLQNAGFPDNSGVYTVPEEHMFLMGDNRDRSQDSRFPQVAGQGIGMVPQENLVGKASFTVFSTDGSASWLLPWTWFTAARWDRIGEGF
ncbi:signal peptidase I [Alterisphingorhabdus coralli]|uniref:Signal peptidase I n=1 Tax=Alterisphingorhabdus coralli TaxID=3071408 RepID=A0AA97I0B2_9SPHN|nr:signal peptidase I [Parasphingorhabdus sp. SCSIO 66989]WOE73995.1 signal peptidase I [Parasphingorhabdus sp. SCSIO 66989]